MQNLLLVGLGGAIGAITRYKIGVALAARSAVAGFPLATLAVNLSGCFLMGLLTGWLTRKEIPAQSLQLFLLTGVLGGYTTFSAFGAETVELLKRGAVGLASGYVAASVVGGVLAVLLGWLIVRQIS